MRMKTWTANCTFADAAEVKLEIMIGDLIDLSFKTEDLDYIEKRFASARNKITAVYDRKSRTVACDDEQVRKLLQQRIASVETRAPGLCMTFSAPR